MGHTHTLFYSDVIEEIKNETHAIPEELFNRDMSPDLYQPDYPEKPSVGTIWVPIYYLPLEMEQQQQRNNTTPMGMPTTHFENHEIVNVIQSDEELEVDVESDEERQHQEQNEIKGEKVSVIRPLSSIIKTEPMVDLELCTEGRKRKQSSHSSSGSGSLKRAKIEPHYEPEIDETLSAYTPSAPFRVIEEHYQYKGDEPGEQDRQYKCKYCRKVFRRKEEKKRHENSHLNIRTHKCRLCDKTFMRADHRNSHEKTHSKEKEYKCDICNKSFRRADEAKRHEQRQIHLRNVARLNGKL